MEEEKLKRYLNSIHKMIKSGNAKYMSYISREYMTYMKKSPVISEAIGNMIFKEVNQNDKSPYAIFLHDNGSICLDAMSDVSKITNVADFIGHIQELSKYDVDFSEVTPDDLILEGDQMLEELEKDLEKEDLTEKDIEKSEEKADKALAKVGILATIGGTIGIAATGIFAKIKAKLSSLKANKGKVAKDEEKIKNQEEKKVVSPEQIASSRLSFDEICPKVDVDEEKAIGQMKNIQLNKDESIKKKNSDTYGDGDPDGDDLDL